MVLIYYSKPAANAGLGPRRSANLAPDPEASQSRFSKGPDLYFFNIRHSHALVTCLLIQSQPVVQFIAYKPVESIRFLHGLMKFLKSLSSSFSTPKAQTNLASRQ